MNQSNEDILISLFVDFMGNDNEKRKDADEKLCELIKTPIFSELCSIATTQDNPTVRYLTVIFIRRSLFIREFNVSPEEVYLLKQFILEYIFKESVEQNCEYAISIGCLLCSKIEDQEEKGLFVNSLIESSIQMATSNIHVALNFIMQLIDSELLNNEIFATCNMGVICHNLILAGLQSEGDESSLIEHERSIDLLHAIYLVGLCDDFLSSSPDILEILQAEAQYSIYQSPDDKESLALFLYLFTIVHENPDELSDSFDFFQKFSYEAIKNRELSPIRREYALLFMNAAYLSQPDFFRNTLEEVLQIIFDILNCKYLDDPEMFQPCFTDSFLINLSSDPDIRDEIYSIIMDIAKDQKAKEDAIGFGISIECLKYISESAAEVFESCSEEVCQLISDAISFENQFVFNEVCNLIILLSKYAFESIEPIFNDLTTFLLGSCNYLEAFVCLENVLKFSNKPPASYGEFIGSLVELLNGESQIPQHLIYMVIDCVNSIVRKIESTDVNLYTEFRPVLIEIMENSPDSRSSVYRCFASFSRIATQAVSEDIESFANAMIEDLSNCSQDPYLVFAIAESISEIVEFIPASFYSYASNFFEAFSQLFDYFSKSSFQTIDEDENNNIDDDEIDNFIEEIDQTQSTCGEILNCLSVIFAAYPSDLASQFGLIYQAIIELLKSEKNILVIGASNSVIVISPFLAEEEEFNPNSIIKLIVKNIEQTEIENENDLLAVRLLFNALYAICSDSGKDIFDDEENDEKALECLGVFFAECLSMKIHSITDESESNILNDLQGCVMNALAAFIMGGAFRLCENQSEIVAILLQHQEANKKRQFQSYAIAALARICFVNQQITGEMAVILLNTIITIFAKQKKRISDGCKNSYFFSMIFILASHPEIADEEMISRIRDIVFASVSFDQEQESSMVQISSAILLIVLCAMFHVELETDLLSHILQILPESDDEGIIVYANCIFEMINGNEDKFQEICNIGKMATTIVLSPKWCYSLIPQNVFSYFIEIVKQIPEDALGEILEHNQAKIIKIKNIIEA